MLWWQFGSAEGTRGVRSARQMSKSEILVNLAKLMSEVVRPNANRTGKAQRTTLMRLFGPKRQPPAPAPARLRCPPCPSISAREKNGRPCRPHATSLDARNRRVHKFNGL